jgi:uncharacterized LabA/DUF88 family protein
MCLEFHANARAVSKSIKRQDFRVAALVYPQYSAPMARFNRSSFPEPAYLFVDAGHIRECYGSAMRDWFMCESEIDYEKLKKRVGAFKLFYYDCLDHIRSAGESDSAFSTRKEQQEAQFDQIRSIVGAHVRLGSLAGSSQKRRRQKGVDILLAVDMMNHAIRQNMRRAVLVTGDADFKPLVESMIQIGMFVEVVGDLKSTSKELVRAADASELLAFDEYFTLAPGGLQNDFPLPDKRRIVYRKNEFSGSVTATGKIGNEEVIISWTDLFNAYIPINSGEAYLLRHRDFELLTRFIKIQFPDVVLKK